MKNNFKCVCLLVLCGFCTPAQSTNWIFGILSYFMPLKTIKSNEFDEETEIKIYEALEEDAVQVIKQLLDKGGDAQNFLIKAVISDCHCPNIIKYLVFQGADINYNYGQRARTVLFWAVENQKIEKIEQLIAIKGCNVNIQNDEGQTPFFDALSDVCSYKIAELLLNTGNCDCDIVDNKGNTILHQAIMTIKDMKKEDDFVKQLWTYEKLQYFITEKNITIQNREGETPLLLALKKQCPPAIIKLLKKHGSDFNTKDFNNKNGYNLIRENRSLYGSFKI